MVPGQLSPIDVQIMKVLRDNQRAGYQSLSDVAISEKVGKEPSIIAGYVKDLAKQGLVRRFPDSFDGPGDTLITDRGLAALDRLGE